MTNPGDEPAPSLKARAKRLAAPVVAKAREEVVKATASDVIALRAEIADLRAELVRQRAEHQAELAAIHEEIHGLLARPAAPRR